MVPGAPRARYLRIPTTMQRSPSRRPTLESSTLRRAVADVVRVNRMREDKAALQQLLQKDAIPESLWTAFQAAEKQLEARL
ncbi:Preprotein translocase subunit Sec66 [Rhizoctonia solani]|uniref:Preprotein translocase subunit Sec66 n=1 Tax=Rhizoctonia solani TaxID=456999 RepID=A0A8H7IJQ9_9AGAM|nr:Preprotein translocase subunit Sec66 [Rhizoctonia solani]